MKIYYKYLIPLVVIVIILAVNTPLKFKDGIFEGRSISIYTQEPYMGNVKIEISNGKFTKVEFMINDTSNNEVFNAEYEKHFSDNPLYLQQCRNDWKGVQTYPGILLKLQDINKVDAISGATWSYNIFKASTLEALKKAK